MNKDINLKLDYVVSKVDNISLEMQNLKIAQSKLESENALLRKDLQALRSELNYLSNKDRAQNVILLNVKDDKETNDNLPNIIKNILNEIKRVGKIEGKRPVLIALNSMEFKKLLFSKQEEFNKKGLKIYNDLSLLHFIAKK